MNIQILDYQPQYQPYFEKFNKAWLEEYYTVEPIDEWVLGNPEDAILKDGGRIYFARYLGNIVGTVALKLAEPGVFELTKMAVDKALRGIGAGKLLCRTAIEKAKELGASRLILYSQTRLSTAIGIYRSLGFTEIKLEAGKYARADIKMELPLSEGLTDAEISSLVESYGKAYEKIMDCLQEIPREIWQWQPPYHKWTIHENLLHLADSEANSYLRCRKFIAEPGATVMAYDQDQWAKALAYHQQSAEDALELFRLLRKMSYELIRKLPSENWNNTIEHPENGTMQLWQWLRVYENHTHIYQMQRVHEAWKKEQASAFLSE